MVKLYRAYPTLPKDLLYPLVNTPYCDTLESNFSVIDREILFYLNLRNYARQEDQGYPPET